MPTSQPLAVDIHYSLEEEHQTFCTNCDAATKKAFRLERQHELDVDTIDLLGKALNDMEVQRDKYVDLLIKAKVIRDRYGR